MRYFSNTCCFTTNVNIHFKCKRPLLRNLCGPKLLPSKLHPKQDLEDQKTCEDAFHHGPTSEEIIMLNFWGKFSEFQIISKLLGYNFITHHDIVISSLESSGKLTIMSLTFWFASFDFDLKIASTNMQVPQFFCFTRLGFVKKTWQLRFSFIKSH